VIGAALIVVGIALAVVPTLLLEIADEQADRIHRAEVAGWSQAHESSVTATNIPATAITPGPEGYFLEIPKIGVRAVVHELEPDVFSGQNTPMLRRYGVGQVPFTPELGNVSPGAEGTAVITGHRTTSGAPFRHIDRLVPGDLIIVRKGELEQRWAVVSSATVGPDQLEAIRSLRSTRRLAVLACTPPFSDKARLIVYAELSADIHKARTVPRTISAGGFGSIRGGDVK